MYISTRIVSTKIRMYPDTSSLSLINDWYCKIRAYYPLHPQYLQWILLPPSYFFLGEVPLNVGYLTNNSIDAGVKGYPGLKAIRHRVDDSLAVHICGYPYLILFVGRLLMVFIDKYKDTSSIQFLSIEDVGD